ncbi:MAG TPA: G5 domain-containing protein [Candidatus Saccharimonadales bacterium]|nr:G5 domain-containing protein [Candidatus Saccharimonadales bacterium]
MKRWFSKDSTKLQLGAVGLVLFLAVTLAGNLGGPAQDRSQQSRQAQYEAAPAQQAAITEKPRLTALSTQVVVSEEEVPFTTTQTYDGTLAKDTTVVRVEGRNGKKIVRAEVKNRDGIEVSRELISQEVTVAPVTKVIAIGTKHVPGWSADRSADTCDPHYMPCVKLSARDIDCREVGHRVRVVTIGEDPYGFDRDDDGEGCENYPEWPGTAENSQQ